MYPKQEDASKEVKYDIHKLVTKLPSLPALAPSLEEAGFAPAELLAPTGVAQTLGRLAKAFLEVHRMTVGGDHSF